jgi:outer membrane receptor protein involved in Fe transport
VEQEAARGTPLLRTGQSRQANLSLSGGTPQARYFVSSGYESESGIEPVSALWRWSGRANLALSPRRDLDLDLSLGMTQQRIQMPFEGGDGIWFHAYYGQPPRTAADSLRRGFFQAPPEVLWRIDELTQRVGRSLASATATHRVGEWLTQRLVAGYDDTSEDNARYSPRMDAKARQFYGNPARQAGSKGARQRTLGVGSVDYSGTAQLRLPRGVTAATSWGSQFFRRNTQVVTASGQGFAATGLSQVDATTTTTGSESFVTNSTLGFYAQEQFAVHERLFVTAALRVDDNSAFGSNFSWVRYPKYSASWVAMDGVRGRVPFIDQLKLRTAYGETGQQPVTFSTLRTFATTATGSGEAGVTPSAIGNPDLRPERGREVEAGLDAVFLGERLTIDLTAYRRITTDAIVAEPVPPSVGFPGTRPANLGRVLTRGVELQARGTVLRRDALTLELGLNVSRNGNRVLDIGGLEFLSAGASNIRHQVGYPVGSYFDYRLVSAAFNADGTTRDHRCDDGAGGTMPCFGQGGAVVAPRVFLGRADPSGEGSVNASATIFRRVRLYGLVDWKTGQTQFDAHTRGRCQSLRLCLENLEPLRYDPVVIAQYESAVLRPAAYADASFARLREVAVAWTAPGAVARRVGASGATVTLAGRNLRLWTRWPGIDPEQFFTSDQFTRAEQAQVPPLRQAVLSLNLTY